MSYQDLECIRLPSLNWPGDLFKEDAVPADAATTTADFVFQYGGDMVLPTHRSLAAGT